MHTALKAHFDGEDPMLTFELYWESVRGKELTYSRFDWSGLQELGRVFIPRFLKLHAKKFKPFKFEERVSMPIGDGHTIEGTADFIGDFEGVPSIVDFKTSAGEYSHSKLLKNQQLWIYAAQAEHTWGYKAEQIVYMVFIKGQERIQIVKHPITKPKLDSMLKDVADMCNDLATRKTFPRNPECYCNFQGECYKGEILHK